MYLEEVDILFVDDEKQVVDLMSVFFDLLGYSYKTTYTGEEALKLTDTINFKVIIIDINLGDTPLNGVELCIKLRKRYKDIKIYAMTAYSELFHDISPEVAGFDKAFFKPEGYRYLFVALEKDLKN